MSVIIDSLYGGKNTPRSKTIMSYWCIITAIIMAIGEQFFSFKIDYIVFGTFITAAGFAWSINRLEKKDEDKVKLKEDEKPA
jgi:hypothetical protein